jgi:drug/metabolite transporter (DMT)-like permease
MSPSVGSPPAPDSKPFGLLLGVMFLQQIFGALTFPFARAGLAHIEPFTFAFYRFGLAAIVLLTIVRLRRYETRIQRGDALRIAGLGALVIFLNQVTYLVGQSLTGAGHGALLFATTPIWIFLLAMLHLRERPPLRRVLGILLALGGVALIMSVGSKTYGREALWGDLIIWVSVLAWAYYAILGKPLATRYGATRVTAYALASGALLYFPFGLYRALQVDYGRVPTSAWVAVAYVGLGTSVGSYILWYWLLKHMEASRVAVFHNVQPVIAVAAAHIFLGEPAGPTFLLGAVIVICGVMITEIGRHPHLHGRRKRPVSL